MVTISIFVIMTALILARYTGFNSGTLLTNVAYDTALTMKVAQTYGLAVRKVDNLTDITKAYFYAYGIDLQYCKSWAIHLFR